MAGSWGKPLMLLSYSPLLPTCRTSVVHITSLPPSSTYVPAPCGPSFLYTLRIPDSAPHSPHPMTAASSARRASTGVPSDKDWPRCIPAPRAQDLGCAESRWHGCWARRAVSMPSLLWTPSICGRKAKSLPPDSTD